MSVCKVTDDMGHVGPIWALLDWPELGAGGGTVHQAAKPNLLPLISYPKLENPRYNSLDFWRGVACLAIVTLHSAFFVKPNLTVAEVQQHHLAAMIYSVISRYFGFGVPIFFVISGYCITATADSSRRKEHPTTHYFKRRLRRIYPPYWAALLVTLAVSEMLSMAGRRLMLSETTLPHVPSVPGISEIKPMQWIGNLTLTEHWREHVAGPREQQIMAPAWTLCYEEQFYAVCGVLLIVSRRRFFTGTLVVSIATILTFCLWATHPQWHIEGFFFDGRWLMFAAGVFVYYHLNYPQPGWRKMWVPGGLLLGIVAIKAILQFMQLPTTDDATDTILYTLRVSFAFALLILVLRPADGPMTRSRLLLPIAICGRMCFSLYLIHWITCAVLGHLLLQIGVRGLVPVLMITVPIVIVVSIALSWGFYVLVERHFLNSTSSRAAAVRNGSSTPQVPDFVPA
jgi:peptidoglycan/LPS O-acetylase OafA/YrhL